MNRFVFVVQFLFLNILLQFNFAWGQQQVSNGRSLSILAKNAITEKKHPSTVSDIMSLRGISKIAVSPDADYVAFMMYEPNVYFNTYHTAWFIASVTGLSNPLNVGAGGEPDLFDTSLRVDGSQGLGWSGANPTWSLDSQWIAYLRKLNGEIQIWRSWKDGKQEQLTHNTADIRSFYLSLDGKEIVFSTGAPRSEIERARKASGRIGFLVKPNTTWSYSHHRPILQRNGLPSDDSTKIWTIDLQSGREAEAGAADRDYFNSYASGRNNSLSSDRGKLELRKMDPEFVHHIRHGAVQQLYFAGSSGAGDLTPCTRPECKGNFDGPTKKDAWLSEGGESAYFWKRDETKSGLVTLYEMVFKNGSVRELFSSRDGLRDCHILFDRLICLSKTPTQPEKIVSIQIENGTMSTLIDPNPHWQGIHTGEAEWVDWTDDEGNNMSGVLVKPVNYVEGKRYPLVVSGYGTDDAVRGDRANRYPTHALSAEGFFVLIYGWPKYRIPLKNKNLSVDKALKKTWVSSYTNDVAAGKIPFQLINSIINQLDLKGFIDRERIGIGGHSMGMNTAAFGLIDSDIFKAVSLGWIRFNPTSYYKMEPDYARDIYIASGLRRKMSEPTSVAMARLSLSLNAARVNAPILVHASDYEFYQEHQAEALVRFKDAQKPIEMYVFPDEQHTFFHPAHRYAENRRNVQWFKYWLQDEEVDDPVDPEQYTRWSKLREQRDAALEAVAK